MCNNFVVLPDISSTKNVIMAKNSDRPSFDSQPLVYNRARKEAFKKQ